MPMPPAFANDLPYSSLRKDRHMPAPPAPPNGPSPSMPVNMWLNICDRNMLSKSTASARALAFGSAAARAPEKARGPAVPSADSAAVPGLLPSVAADPISHHLDIGLDGAGSLDGLQDRDHVARPDAERVQSIDKLL